MSITNKNQNLTLIIELLGNLLPDDIKNKIILLLLGIGKKIDTKYSSNMFCGGNQYELNTQINSVQCEIMCEIQIAKFDAAVNKKKTEGAVKTIKKYMKVLDDKFKLRYKILFC